MDRDVFLNRVRAARSSAPEGPPSDPGPLVPDLDHQDPVARFVEEVGKVDGSVHLASDEEEAYGIITDIMGDYRTFMARDPLPIAGLPARLIADGFTIVSPEVPHTPAERTAHQLRYETLEVGITDAVAGLVESGSVVVTAEQGRPRMASLIPFVHIALLPADRLFPSLTHFLAAEPERVSASSNLVVITGPSRTGDIEHRLTLGVHGPRYLHVVLLGSEF